MAVEVKITLGLIGRGRNYQDSISVEIHNNTKQTIHFRRVSLLAPHSRRLPIRPIVGDDTHHVLAAGAHESLIYLQDDILAILQFNGYGGEVTLTADVRFQPDISIKQPTLTLSVG